MKLLWFFLAAIHLQAFEYALKPVQVSDEIYCFFGKAEAMNRHNNGNMVNTCFVDMKGSWLLIDSGPSYAYAKEALDIMQKIKSQGVSYVINSHVHDDHWLGNGFYKEYGAKIIGSYVFKSEVNPHEETRMQKNISKVAFRKTVVTLPSIFIQKDRTLRIGDNLVKLIHLKGEGHSKGDIIVHIPKLKAAFAGDLIFNSRILSLRDGDINNWIDILEKIESMNLDYLIGGHGEKTSKDSLLMTKRYLFLVKDAVKKALDEGRDIDEAVASIDFKEFKNIPMYKELHKRNVGKAYQSLEWDDE